MSLQSPVRQSRRDSWEAKVAANNKARQTPVNSRESSPSPSEAELLSDTPAFRDLSPARSDADDDGDDGEWGNDENSKGENDGREPGKGTWTREEHKRFLEAIKIYVNGPWKAVAEYVGTRTVRQTMTHAQKYRQKAARRIRGLRTKQAIMRMHCGHEVSEESMMQERIRTLMGQSRHGYFPPELCAPYMQPQHSPTTAGAVYPNGMPMPLAPAMPYPTSQPILPGMESALTITVKAPPSSGSGNSLHTLSTPYASPVHSAPSSPVGAQTPLTVVAPHPAGEELELSDDLSNSPTLEECANVLLDVLFDQPEVAHNSLPSSPVGSAPSSPMFAPAVPGQFSAPASPAAVYSPVGSPVHSAPNSRVHTPVASPVPSPVSSPSQQLMHFSYLDI
ncbi:hypothetical protein ATCC90586_008012 [Pythium insidiosum]|nr:hypothetical protein ATCC90586_008012 [Pythium insidiosum]